MTSRDLYLFAPRFDVKICKTDARPCRLSPPAEMMKISEFGHCSNSMCILFCLQFDCVDRVLGLKVKQAGRFVGCGLLSLSLERRLAASRLACGMSQVKSCKLWRSGLVESIKESEHQGRLTEPRAFSHREFVAQTCKTCFRWLKMAKLHGTTAI